MAQQMIGIGTVANDGTGDTLRVAGDKINDNFTELYAGLVGLLDFKGSQDCSANPNYPAASKGDFYLVSVAGKIGGASGISVEAGDTYFATADNAGGTQAGVGTSWTVIQGNVTAYISSLTGDVTTSGSGAAAATIANNAVTFAKMVAAASAGVVWASAAGNYSHNASGGGTTNFLRADGTWAAPPGSGGFTAASTTEVLTGTDSSKGVTSDSLAAIWEQGSDVASSGTISVGEGGYFNITGTTTITDIDFATDKAGRKAWVKFAGALTLTHNASTLILPTGANITTAAGDTACFISEGSDVVRCVSYNRASGAALSGGGATSYERTRSVPLAANFTLDNAGTASMANGTNALILTTPAASNNARIIRSNTALPSTPYSMIVRAAPVSPLGGAAVYAMCLFARNSSNGRLLVYGDYNNGQHLAQYWSSYTAFSSNSLSPATAYFLPWLPWMRFRNDGTNIYIGRSSDGNDWAEFHTVPLATYLTASGGTVDQMGFGTFMASFGTEVKTAWQSYEIV